MNLQEVKESTAIEHGFKSYAHIVQMHKDGCSVAFDDYFEDCMKLHATEKVKEALKLAAERAYIEYVPSRIPYGGEDAIVDKDSILDLETELIERINKEK